MFSSKRFFQATKCFFISLALAGGACEVGGGDAGEFNGEQADIAALQVVTAEFDATLGAPVCGDFATECDSGALLDGRGPLGPEPNQPNTLDGCADGSSGTYHSDESLDRLRVYTSDNSWLEPGKTVTVEATVWAWSYFGTDALDLYYAADAEDPEWLHIATVPAVMSGQQTLTATYVVPEGDLQAIRGVFHYYGSGVPCTSGGYNDHDDLVFVAGAPDTTPPVVAIDSHIDADRAKGKVYVSAGATDNVGVARVEFTVDGVNIGTATSAPYRALWNTAAGADGARAVVATAYDDAGNSSASAITVTVHNGDGQGNALHDALLAPGCRAVSSTCDAGDLVEGRGVNAGPELNQPNTINGSCADGSYGVWQSGEQLDRIRVYTTNGEPMAAGSTVTIEATVWVAYPGDEDDDSLDLFHAPDASNPVWSHITTLQPDSDGAQVLTATFTLPAGGLQAVRGVFRWAGSVSPCDPSANGWVDHDDLIFAVD